MFLVGIIAPTAFLVYLGVGAIRTETLLLRQESNARIGKTSLAIAAQAQTLVDNALAPFAHAATAGAEQPGMIVIDADNRLLFPCRDARAHPVVAPAPLSETLQAKVGEAERAEFKDRAYADAAAAYQTLEQRVETPRWKAILLSSRAGCLAKAGRYDAAEAAYQEILSRYPTEQNADGFPFGLIIASQLGDVQKAKGRADLAATFYNRALQDLRAGRWDLTWNETQFFARHVIERLPSAEASWAEYARVVESARRFVNGQWPALQRRLRTSGWDRQTMLVIDHNVGDAWVYAPTFDVASGALHTVLLSPMNTQPLLSALRDTLESLTSAANLTYRLQLGSRDISSSEKRLPLSAGAFHQPLAHVTPGLELAIAPLNDAPVQRAAERRRQIYLAMVILAVIVIAIALYATWYAVSREVEVAQLKSRFVAGISHELKTPLSIIGLIGEKLHMGRYASEEEAREFYAMLTEETARLKTLIDDVLDFSRLLENRQPYRRDKMDAAELVEDTVRRFRESNVAPGLDIVCAVQSRPCWVAADKDALARALLNLLDNAVKYSPADRLRLRVALSATATHALLSVADEGYGIPSQEQAQVFERFYRGQPSAERPQTKGVGLGLSIVQHIVTAHGGRVELKSEVGKGSIFTIHLPLWTAHA